MNITHKNQESEILLNDWQVTPLMKIANVRTGKKDANHAKVNGKYRFYTCAHEHMLCDTISFEGECLILPGNGANVGDVFYYNGEFEAYQRTYIIEGIKIFPKYLFYHLRYNWKSINADKQFGSATNYIRIGNFENYIVKYPNPSEQKQIVAEIEKQFSRLDEAVENLKRIKSNLKRYKASVLKAAVEGKLTEEWRKANPDVEPADKLLDRILLERKKKWEEAELARVSAKGKLPEDDKWKKKYEEPEIAEQIEIELPDNWTIATVKQLAEKVQYGSSSKTSEGEEGIPVFRMGNIYEGKLLLDNLKYLPESHNEFPELLLKPDDLLFNRTNSPELVGKTAVYIGKPSPCSFASYLIRVHFNNKVNPYFISCFINSNYGRKWIKSVVSQQVGQANVNGTKLQALSVPLPPYIEQNFIVKEVENRFSIIDAIGEQVDRQLIRADRLKQSILKKAFSGKLVASSDEYEKEIPNEMLMAAEGLTSYGAENNK